MKIIMSIAFALLSTSIASAESSSAERMLERCISKKASKLKEANDLVEKRNQFIAEQNLRSVLVLDDDHFQDLLPNQQDDLDCLNAVKTELLSP